MEPTQLTSLIAAWLPAPAFAAVAGPPFLAFALLAGAGAGHLRVRRGVRVAYTRKIYHFTVLTAAWAVHVVWGRPAAVLFGVTVAAAVLYAVWRGDGHPFYEAMARPADRPRRSLFIVVPLVTTAAGGVLTNLLFPRYAAVGYLVCGWGDAVGEPAGARWGNHPYPVPSLAGVAATRTREGSLAVAVASWMAATTGLVLTGAGVPEAMGVGLAVAAVTAGVEAVAHHGTDNLAIQVAAAGTAAFF